MRTLELSEEQVEEICFQLGTLMTNTEDLRKRDQWLNDKPKYKTYSRELESAGLLYNLLDDWLMDVE